MSRGKFFLVGLVAIISFVLAGSGLQRQIFPSVFSSGATGSCGVAGTVRNACEKRLLEAERQAMEAVGDGAELFADFIEEQKPGAAAFARDVVSLRGKWEAAKSFLPFTDPDGHKQYLRARFAEHVFTEDELENALTASVHSALRELESVENYLAVSLQEEIVGHDLSAQQRHTAAEDFRRAVDKLTSASQGAALRGGAGLVATEGLALVGMHVLARTAVSVGILSAGGANAWWSFGGAIAIGLLVDAVWDRFDDPAGDIERQVMAELDNIAQKGTAKIRLDAMAVLNERRAHWRRVAMGR